MRNITTALILIFLLPIALAQSICTDIACLDMSLTIWQDMDCFEKICNKGYHQRII
tara:strand:+ start:239 stop:406 length:168 start_codon:yes stop_codon:yes gene_type:complete